MRWGLVGASTIAAEHMIGALRGTGQDVAVVVSGDRRARARVRQRPMALPARRPTLARCWPMPAIEAVYISSTNEKHHAQALAAIAAGKHVLCEKPLAMTVAEAAEHGRGGGSARAWSLPPTTTCAVRAATGRCAT